MSEWNFIKKNKVKWIAAIVLIIGIKIFTSDPLWIERVYSCDIYITFSKFLRIFFGWIPFSLGDVLYFLAFCWIIWKIIKIVRLVIKKGLTKKIAFQKFLKIVFLFASIYIIFYLFWGMNYDRKGIAFQLQITLPQYDTADLFMVENILLEKVNSTKTVLAKSHENYPSTRQLILRAKKCYGEAKQKFPFLTYKRISIKSSLYGTLGNYLGFTGYYNPFTGEAQINTAVPQVLHPYIATHEIAHQLGYAKENEANFVGYLAAANSDDTLFQYSTYLDLFLYTNREIYYFDSLSSRNMMEKLNPLVMKDLEELKQFNLAHQNFLEPLISWMYGNYLKLNNQPKGLHSYNAVVGMLIAYYKKYGKI